MRLFIWKKTLTCLMDRIALCQQVRALSHAHAKPRKQTTAGYQYYHKDQSTSSYHREYTVIPFIICRA
ncbi:hypothetical protein E2C01_098452 [Portunus trituberculatus]|uniref:Uncharacterized protein n=1 Tax=Portunus trituberculatus TaxID=210409 RepID=A0A5B7K7P6_PORTR|nr:hypothetical protein [Portunus trituberculatus]